jgi:hypothetical protein
MLASVEDNEDVTERLVNDLFKENLAAVQARMIAAEATPKGCTDAEAGTPLRDQSPTTAAAGRSRARTSLKHNGATMRYLMVAPLSLNANRRVC